MPHEVVSEGFPQPPVTVDTHIWAPGPDGYRHLVRTKTIREVFDEVRAVVGPEPPGAEDYFRLPSTVSDDNCEWPTGRVIVLAVTGDSEGHYVHVEVLNLHGCHCMMLGKTLQGKDAAWTLARQLADLLEV